MCQTADHYRETTNISIRRPTPYHHPYLTLNPLIFVLFFYQRENRVLTGRFNNYTPCPKVMRRPSEWRRADSQLIPHACAANVASGAADCSKFRVDLLLARRCLPVEPRETARRWRSLLVRPLPPRPSSTPSVPRRCTACAVCTHADRCAAWRAVSWVDWARAWPKCQCDREKRRHRQAPSFDACAAAAVDSVAGEVTFDVLTRGKMCVYEVHFSRSTRLLAGASAVANHTRPGVCDRGRRQRAVACARHIVAHRRARGALLVDARFQQFAHRHQLVCGAELALLRHVASRRRHGLRQRQGGVRGGQRRGTARACYLPRRLVSALHAERRRRTPLVDDNSRCAATASLVASAIRRQRTLRRQLRVWRALPRRAGPRAPLAALGGVERLHADAARALLGPLASIRAPRQPGRR